VGSVQGWGALSDGFLLQDVVAAGVGEAGEKRDEAAAGEAVSPAAWRLPRGRCGTAAGLGGRAAGLGGRAAGC